MDVAASEFYGSDNKTYDLNFKEEVSSLKLQKSMRMEFLPFWLN